MMKHFFLLTFLCGLAARAYGQVSADCQSKRSVDGYDIVLLMGQSNMQGFGQGYIESIDGVQDPRIQQWSRANTIIPARECLDHWQCKNWRVGMGTSFARSYLETLPSNRRVLLVPAALGGTALINGPWSPGGYLFEDAMRRLQAALGTSSGNCVAAVLWHQGEADVGRGTATYKAAFDNMVNTMRTRVPQSAQVPLIVGEFTEKWQARVSTDIRQALADTPFRLSNAAFAPSTGLVSNPGDDIHFNAAAMREYGRRYFQAMSRIVPPPSVNVENIVGPFEVEAVVRFENLQGHYQRVIDFGNGAGQDNVVLAQHRFSNDMILVIWNGNSYKYVSARNAIVQGRTDTWKAGVDASGLMWIERNGSILVQKAGGYIPRNVTRSNLFIGQSNWAGDTPLIGQVLSLTVRDLSGENVFGSGENGSGENGSGENATCAQLPGGFFKLINQYTGLAANVYGASTDPGAAIIQWPVSWPVSGANENWFVQEAPDGYYYVISQNSNLSMNIARNSDANGADVIQWTQGNFVNAQWCFEDVGGDYYELKNRMSGKVLSNDGLSMTWAARLIQWESSGAMNQRWRIEAA